MTVALFGSVVLSFSYGTPAASCSHLPADRRWPCSSPPLTCHLARTTSQTNPQRAALRQLSLGKLIKMFFRMYLSSKNIMLEIKRITWGLYRLTCVDSIERARGIDYRSYMNIGMQNWQRKCLQEKTSVQSVLQAVLGNCPESWQTRASKDYEWF